MLIEPVSNLTSLCYSKLFKCEVLQAGSSSSIVFSYLSYCLCPVLNSIPSGVLRGRYRHLLLCWSMSPFYTRWPSVSMRTVTEPTIILYVKLRKIRHNLLLKVWTNNRLWLCCVQRRCGLAYILLCVSETLYLFARLHGVTVKKFLVHFIAIGLVRFAVPMALWTFWTYSLYL